MAVYDKDGNEIEGGMTKEEVETNKLAAIEEYKKANPVPVIEKPAEPVVEKKDEEIPAWAKQLSEKVDALSSTQSTTAKATIASQFAGSDPAKQLAFLDKFDKFTGYPETPEGQRERATDAAKAAFGDGVNVADMAGTGGNRNVDNSAPKTLDTPVDKGIQNLLGIKAEDVTKFAPKVDETKK